MNGILFVFEDFCQVVQVPKEECDIPGLVQHFRKTCKYYGEVKVQHFNERFHDYVDVSGYEDFCNSSADIKIRFLKVKEQNLRDDNCAVLCCDMQERFRSAISCFDQIVQVADRMLKASKILSLPLIVTEQYPKGLLNTVKELDIEHASLCLPKTRFSMLEDQVMEFFELNSKTTSVVLFGVEAHVCVQQTALDLMRHGLQVYVVADATSSRFAVDRKLAYQRLQSAGAIITTSESVLFQMIRDKNHEHFKAIQKLVITPVAEQPSLMSAI